MAGPSLVYNRGLLLACIASGILGLLVLHLILQDVYEFAYPPSNDRSPARAGQPIERPGWWRGSPNAATPIQTRPAYARFLTPTEPERASDVVDIFADFAHAADCGISSLDLHLPFSPLCDDRLQLLEAMSSGGRAGYDTPYIPRGCDMRWYSTAELCAIFARFDHVFVIGDSLQRHLTGALNILLRADMGFGGIRDWNLTLNSDKNVRSRNDCKCQRQIEHHECSIQAIFESDWVIGNVSSGTATSISDESSGYACPSESMAALTYLPFLQYPLSAKVLESLSGPMPKARGPRKPYAFIMHNELWNDVNTTETTLFLDQISDHLKSTIPWILDYFPRLFLTANAGGMTKGLGLMLTQGNQALAKFELEMRPRVAQMGKDFDFLGFFNMSVQSTQWDGAHTTMETNLIKAMMVINWLDRLDTNSYRGYEVRARNVV